MVVEISHWKNKTNNTMAHSSVSNWRAVFYGLVFVTGWTVLVAQTAYLINKLATTTRLDLSQIPKEEEWTEY